MPVENRNYLQPMAHAQLRLGERGSDSSRALGPNMPQSSINSLNPQQRLIANQYS